MLLFKFYGTPNFFRIISNIRLINNPVKDRYAAENYATYFCNSFEEELPALNTLYDLIKSKNLTVTGDYICEVVYEIPNKSKNNRKMFIRLQIPVSL